VGYWRRDLFLHPETVENQPLVASSACLLGEPVRHDSGHRQQAHFEQLLLPHLQLQAICPEVGIGMGVPRPTLKVIDANSGPRVVQVQDPGNDVTDALLDYADSYMRKIGRFWPLTAYIFKARSPSCGVSATPVNPDTPQQHPGTGAFAGRVQLWATWLPLYEEEDLQTESACAELILLSFICRDILWQGGGWDEERGLAHYSRLLGELSVQSPDRMPLWEAVRASLSALGKDRRGELIERYRVA
jgi:uncharacterized protein YbbK (DUF523 family)